MKGGNLCFSTCPSHPLLFLSHDSCHSCLLLSAALSLKALPYALAEIQPYPFVDYADAEEIEGVAESVTELVTQTY